MKTNAGKKVRDPVGNWRKTRWCFAAHSTWDTRSIVKGCLFSKIFEGNGAKRGRIQILVWLTFELTSCTLKPRRRSSSTDGSGAKFDFKHSQRNFLWGESVEELRAVQKSLYSPCWSADSSESARATSSGSVTTWLMVTMRGMTEGATKPGCWLAAAACATALRSCSKVTSFPPNWKKGSSFEGSRTLWNKSTVNWKADITNSCVPFTVTKRKEAQGP